MAASALPLHRKLLFAAILATFVLVLLLGGLELVLRLRDYGFSPGFFRKEKLSDGEAIWRENPWCTAPYFSAELARHPQPLRLPGKKTPGTYRIFVLGSSAAMGDPEASFSFARVLDAMLRTAYPQQRFEVVNAAITAINSNLVRGIAEDCAKLEPDLFIVYEGHNEVIGPFGPAGVFAPFLQTDAGVRAAVWLKGTRSGQLLANLTQPKDALASWGGMEMFLRQQVVADDPRLDSVRAHFRANLLAIGAAAHRAGAVTLLCTPLTNQRDFAPFRSQHRPGLTAAQLKQWDGHFHAAEAAVRAGDSAGAEQAYRAALAIDDRYAELIFRLGRLALQGGRDDEARTLLARALELDALRFRTDASLNEIIRDVGRDHAFAGQVIDLAQLLAAKSPHGIPGDEFLYEHVHLTFRGAYEVAGELFGFVSGDLSRRGMVPKAAPVPFEVDEARIRLGYNAYEQGMITQEMIARFGRPPFTWQSDNGIRLRNWQHRAGLANELLSRPDATAALTAAAQRAMELAPDDWILQRNTGAMLASRGEATEALPLLQRAAAWIDDDDDTLRALLMAHHALGHTAEEQELKLKMRRLIRYPLHSGPAL